MHGSVPLRVGCVVVIVVEVFMGLRVVLLPVSLASAPAKISYLAE